MSKRLNLREFQQNLIDRLRVKDLSAARVDTLGVQIAGRNWLVDMVDISEVLPLPTLTAVPFTRPWFRGVANVRGNLFSVVDMAAYEHSGTAASTSSGQAASTSSGQAASTGSGQVSGDANNRVLLVADRFAFNVALLVDRVLGLRDARTWSQSEVDGQIEYRDEQSASWRKLDVRGLLGQAEFLQIGV
jgi:twitching motility protein PilI